MSTSTTTSLTAVSTANITGGFYWGDDSAAATKKFPAIYFDSGTFSPNLTFGGGSTGMTFSAHIGNWVRLGTVVFFQIDITMTAKGSSTGSAVIPNLPFTANATYYGGAKVAYAANLATITGEMLLDIDVSTTNLNLRQLTSGTAADLTHSNFTNTTRIIISGFYTV